jgi:hypothetical protein
MIHRAGKSVPDRFALVNSYHLRSLDRARNMGVRTLIFEQTSRDQDKRRQPATQGMVSPPISLTERDARDHDDRLFTHHQGGCNGFTD